MMAAHLVVVPVILRPAEIDALEGTLQEFGEDYPILLVPNLVPAHNPPLRLLERVERIVRSHGVPVAPPISEHRWWARSTRRAALLSLSNPGARVRRAVAELRAFTDTVKEMIHRGERP
jgi:hypothetical protein